MPALEPMPPILVADALRLCELARTENRRRWWNPMAIQCPFCVRFSPTPERRCFAAKPGNRGCPFVNRQWARSGRAPR